MYHILPELKLRRVFPAFCFVNKNPPEERVQVLISEKERSKRPEDSSSIFKKSNFGHYMERPNATFCNGKHSILDNFCYAEVLANAQLKKNQVAHLNISQMN